MGGAKIRLFFVLYILSLGILAMGRFNPETQAVLRSLGLRSAVGMLGYMLAGAVVAYTFLWFKGHQYPRADQSRRRPTYEDVEIRQSLQYPRLRPKDDRPGPDQTPEA